jgi:hypothetical protein
MKKWVWFDRVEMQARKGKAPESILKHPDQVGAAKENRLALPVQVPQLPELPQSPPLSPPPPSKPLLPLTPPVPNTTPIEDPTIVLKVVNHTLNIPISITQKEILSISPEAWQQYKELTMTQQVSARTMEVSKL